MVKNIFTYSEVVELLKKFNPSEVENVEVWLEQEIDDGLSKQEKISYICENESKIMTEIMKGHKAWDNDEYQPVREKIKKYRKQLGFI